MEQDNQQQFISWLAEKLGAKDENDLKSKIQSMGQEGIKQAYNAFLQEQQQQVPAQALGGKLEYLRCLQAFKSGGAMKMKECGCGGKMEKGGKMSMDEMDEDMNNMKANKEAKKPSSKQFIKHQTGGTFAFDPSKSVQVAKVDTNPTNYWGSNIRTQPRMYALHATNGGVNQISEDQLTHLRNNVPGFDRAIGQPIQVEGQVPRFGPEQSDLIRKLSEKYGAHPQVAAAPAVQQPAPMLVASKAKGGMLGKKEYMRGESSTKDMGEGGTRGDEAKVWQSQGDRKDKDKQLRQGNGTRMDKNLADAKAKKKYIRGAEGKKEHTALTTVPKGKEGMATPAQKKMIMLKEQDAKKGQDGMSMPALAPRKSARKKPQAPQM
jgi:hypothetical protein